MTDAKRYSINFCSVILSEKLYMFGILFNGLHLLSNVFFTIINNSFIFGNAL